MSALNRWLSKLPFLFAAIACAACGKPDPNAPNMKRIYKIEPLTYPHSDDANKEFAACAPGVVLVPHGGGVVVAGYNGWLIEPQGAPITSVACDEAGDLFFLQDGKLKTRHRNGPADEIFLPPGDYQILATVDPIVWLYGTLDDHRGVIFHYEKKDGLRLVYAGDKAVQSAAVIGTTGISAVIGEDLYAWRGGPTPTDEGRVGEAVDGLAVGTDGSVFFSGPKGVVRVHSFSQGNVERVAATIHGPLRLRGDVLYVMWRETSAVLRFQPRVVDTNPPKKSGGGFFDGPASRRSESMDIQLGYVGISDVAPISISNGTVFSSVVLGNTATYHGVSVGLGMLTMFSRYLVGGPRLGMLFGDVPIVKATPKDSGAGVVQPSASIFIFQAALPIGFRIPLGWFSLSGGNGIEANLTHVTVSKDSFGTTSGESANGLFFPTWGRLEFEPTCGIGLYGEGGYSYSLLGDAPSHYTFGAGLELRMAVTCRRPR